MILWLEEGTAMAEAVADDGAFAEAIVFMVYFNELPDHRQSGKVIYPLDEVLLLCLLAVLAGAEAFTDIAAKRSRIKLTRCPGL